MNGSNIVTPVLLLICALLPRLAFTLPVGLGWKSSRSAWPLGIARNLSGVLFIYFKILCLWEYSMEHSTDHIGWCFGCPQGPSSLLDSHVVAYHSGLDHM